MFFRPYIFFVLAYLSVIPAVPLAHVDEQTVDLQDIEPNSIGEPQGESTVSHYGVEDFGAEADVLPVPTATPPSFPSLLPPPFLSPTPPPLSPTLPKVPETSKAPEAPEASPAPSPRRSHHPKKDHRHHFG